MTTVGSGTADSGTTTVQFASETREGAEGLFFFLTPLDLLVAKGTEMQIDDGRALNLAYRSCHA